MKNKILKIGSHLLAAILGLGSLSQVQAQMQYANWDGWYSPNFMENGKPAWNISGVGGGDRTNWSTTIHCEDGYDRQYTQYLPEQGISISIRPSTYLDPYYRTINNFNIPLDAPIYDPVLSGNVSFTATKLFVGGDSAFADKITFTIKDGATFTGTDYMEFGSMFGYEAITPVEVHVDGGTLNANASLLAQNATGDVLLALKNGGIVNAIKGPQTSEAISARGKFAITMANASQLTAEGILGGKDLSFDLSSGSMLTSSNTLSMGNGGNITIKLSGNSSFIVPKLYCPMFVNPGETTYNQTIHVSGGSILDLGAGLSMSVYTVGTSDIKITDGGQIIGTEIAVTAGNVLVSGVGSALRTEHLNIFRFSESNVIPATVSMTIENGGYVSALYSISVGNATNGTLYINGVEGKRGVLDGPLTGSYYRPDINAGRVTINGGVVKSKTGGLFIYDFASGQVVVNAGGAFFETADSAYCVTNAPISGVGVVTKQGDGTLIMTTGASNYTGGTSVKEGALLLAASASVSSAVTAESGTTFGGSGSAKANGGATLKSGSVLQIGGIRSSMCPDYLTQDLYGTLNIRSSLTMQPDTIVSYTLYPGNNVNSKLDLAGATTVSFQSNQAFTADLSSFTAGNYTYQDIIKNYTGAAANQTNIENNWVFAGTDLPSGLVYNATFKVRGNSVDLVLTVGNPEIAFALGEGKTAFADTNKTSYTLTGAGSKDYYYVIYTATSLAGPWTVATDGGGNNIRGQIASDGTFTTSYARATTDTVRFFRAATRSTAYPTTGTVGTSSSYSGNVVGYYEKTLPAGSTRLWSCQLDSKNTAGYAVSSLFAGLPGNSTVELLNNTGIVTGTATKLAIGANWQNGTLVISPHAIVRVKNGSATTVGKVVFAGEVKMGTFTNSLAVGAYMMASPRPMTQTLAEMGIAKVGNDSVKRYVSNNATTTTYTVTPIGMKNWNPSEPRMEIGEAFVFAPAVVRDWTEYLGLTVESLSLLTAIP